ncbi:MAG: lipoyl synthase [candidate division WOR-3 bacterium]|nr:lipoyl synthase [candidate division WOR-3 bacterium]MCX7947000.1 lipoyl synthase [candidate division WOR-3 bacterium]MDW8149959.1 lipoyl synthase [candidate division WOR-3 bacterium]
MNKPEWLKIKLEYNDKFYEVKDILRNKKLYTVCEEAKCPNINECWSHGTATIMILGDTCTRNCKFCAVKTGNPKGWIDPLEPIHVVETIRHLNLRYVVITMVDRDDLVDGGAFHVYRTILEIRKNFPDIKIEALVGDFQANRNSISLVAKSPLDVFAHNIETVERLTSIVRDPRASYKQSLFVLEHAKNQSSNILTKSSIMVGLGETEEEVIQTMKDLRNVGVDILTIGQYLQPSKRHLSVVEYVPPYKFKWYRDRALEIGFKEVFSGPLVRSSYRADKVFYGEI